MPVQYVGNRKHRALDRRTWYFPYTFFESRHLALFAFAFFFFSTCKTSPKSLHRYVSCAHLLVSGERRAMRRQNSPVCLFIFVCFCRKRAQQSNAAQFYDACRSYSAYVTSVHAFLDELVRRNVESLESKHHSKSSFSL